MKYRHLGRTGLNVSRICLGTMTFGTAGWGCDAASASAIVKTFLDAGGNFIDTADMYSQGKSEEMTGAAIRDIFRDDLVIATKCWFRQRPTANAKGLSRKHILSAAEASLRRLNTDYIDLYQIHGPDPFTPIEETLRALEDLVRSGKVRYLGCSNLFGWQIAQMNGVADRLGISRLISGQHMYNLLRRDIEREILPACASEGMGLLCWSPLAGGMLTGKYDRQSGPAPESRVALRADVDLPRYWNDASFRILDELVVVAKELQRTPAQVALAWLLHDERVTSVIVGAKSAEQLESSLVAGDWDLPSSCHERLAQVVPFAHGYPREWIEITWPNIAE